MKILITALIVIHTALTPTIFADEAEDSQAVLHRYKLAALTGLMQNSLLSYKQQLDPAGKQCVLLSLGYEFSGEFLFFAQRVGTEDIEIVCFTPRGDGGKEWSGRFVKYDGEIKKQFENIHKLLGELTSHPREKPGDLDTVYGGARFEIRVGDGEDVTWAQPRGIFINNQPKFKKKLSESIAIAATMSQMPLSAEFE